ncbi:MAG TPA: helix-turn-helix domain-containing protein [Acidimicrobiia bacterium]|jgi:AcrR family transcriptional regulator
MRERVKRQYDNSRRLAQVRATRLKVIDAAKSLFIEHGYPATTLDSVADAADVPLPTLYRLFKSKRALLSAVLDTSFGGDDEPVAFVDRDAVQRALSESDPRRMLEAFATIATELLGRSSAIQQVLASAAQVDAEAAGLLTEIRRQRHTGQSRIIAALVDRGALDPGLEPSEAADLVYLLMSPDAYRILTIERGWKPETFDKWLAHVLCRTLLAPE